MLRKLILLFLNGYLIGCSTQDKDLFILKGQLLEGKSQQLVFNYTDRGNNEIRDTIEIDNGKFFAKGYVNGPTRASLSGNCKTNSVEDPNFLFFFIEPGEMEISLIEDNFKNAKIKGSIAQKENEDLSKIVEPYIAEINSILPERNILFSKMRTQSNDSIERRLEEISKFQKLKLDEIKNTYLNYASSNPNSHLSAFWVNWYFRQISHDSVKVYYNSFSDDVKKGLYGSNIFNLIEQRKASEIGDLAPNFQTKTLKGEIISLNSFKGQYILLDFWAGWCKPCREVNPELVRLHSQYFDKGFRIVGISLDKNRIDWRRAVEDDNLESWHHIFIGIKDDTMRIKYNIAEIPAYILIDKDGFIIARHSNKNTFGIQDLKGKLENVFE